jgi:cellulase/cellobiase CelA1
VGAASSVASVASSSSSFSSSSVARSSTISSSGVSSSSVVSSSSQAASSVAPTGNCTYVVGNEWNTGFSAAIRIKNNGTNVINGWNVSWSYSDGTRVTNSWNANVSGSNPYAASNLGWNGQIQPGQTVEFGFQGNKGAASIQIPIITGSVCQ